MSRPKLSLLLLTAALLCSSHRLFAFDDWLPINPAELRMMADPAHPADAIILYHEETADDMTHHKYVYMRVKIFTEKGKNQANVEIPYDASYAGISEIKARTIAPDGTITPFSGKAFTSTIARAQGVKYLAKTFTLPNVQVGSIVEWKYTEYWETYVVAPHWVVQQDLFQKRAKFTFVPFVKAGQYIEDSRGTIKDHVYYWLIGLPEKTEIKSTANNRLELELKDIPAFEEEAFSPPSAVMKMRVNFYYGTDKMAKPQEFWKSEGKFWSKEVEQFAGHSSALAATVNQVIAPSDTAEQRARKIYAFVQKIKNLNYSRLEGAMEEMLIHESKEKRTVEDVLQKKEGYRDEIARLFWGMARAANLTTYQMRISDRDEVFFQPSIPNPSQLTSEIVVVVLDGKEVFLDPGTPFCPFGHLAWQHTATEGLRQTADGNTTLAPTPTATYKDAVSKRVARLTLSDDGSVKGKVGIAWAGEGALIRRVRGLKTDAEGRKTELEDQLKSSLPEGSQVQLDSSAGWDDIDAQLTANFSVEIPSYASTTGTRMLVPSNLFQQRSRQPFAQGERKNPVYFNYPYYSADETQITFPAAFHVENLPAAQPLRTDYAIYTIKHSVAGNTVTISRAFGMAGIAFQKEDYPELRKFYAGVATADTQPLVLTTKQ